MRLIGVLLLFALCALGLTTSTSPTVDVRDATATAYYYVDSDAGNDGWTGLTPSTAWRTLPGTRTVANTGFRQPAWGGINTGNKVPCGSVILLKGGTTHDTNDSAGAVWIDPLYYNECTAAQPTTIKVATSGEWAGSVGDYTIDGSGVTLTAQPYQWPADPQPTLVAVAVSGVSLLGRSDTQRIALNDAADDSAILIARNEPGEVRDFLGEWWEVNRHQGRAVRTARVRNGRISYVVTDIGGRAGIASGINFDHYAVDFAFTDFDIRRAGYEDPGSFGESDGIFMTGKLPGGAAAGTHNQPICIRCKVSRSGKRGVNIGSIDDAYEGPRDFLFRDLEVVENGDWCGYPPGGQGYCSTHWTGNHGAACSQESDCTGTKYFGEPKCRGTIQCSGAGVGGSGNNGTVYDTFIRIVGFKAFRNGFEAIYQYGGGSYDLWQGSTYNSSVGYRPLSGGKGDFLYKIDAPKQWVHNTAVQATTDNAWTDGGGSGNPGWNTRCTGAGQPWACCTGSGTGTCSAEGGAQMPRIGDSCWRHASDPSQTLGLSWCENPTDRHDACSDPGVAGTFTTPNPIHFPADNLTGAACNLAWTSTDATTWASNNWTPTAGSSLIDAGRFLMKTASGGTGTVIPVIANGGSSDPRHYFFGQNSYLSPAAADTKIEIEGCGERFIQSMTATTITITQSCTYANGAGIHLPWNGTAPDIGAVEAP